ncbi:MAG: 3D-(3,5/4)-trihydroxycyclohexane-1,2-dione acylhydrolase (decyclizing) [Synergistaceae bacterium]|jgi:3D-(3,5/4)-trihydroxycyclohexane-1,2-dione acylhydrolase (decyclizing)|nr:3D-(3,5/4)-trihydroxycyclohexane-1,2-dione acylhydrolase (decyclizing) [Synergistaceae bacterium]
MENVKTIRLTVGQAIVRFLDSQYVEFDGVESKFVKGVITVFGHGIVLGIGEAMASYNGDMRFYMGKNEQGMAHTAIGYAKQKNRREIIACAASIGPGTTNFATAAGTATVNRIPLLLFCGDTYATRQPDPVLQQLEQPANYSVTVADSLKPLSKYWDRVTRPEQVMSALLNAFRVLTDPVETGAVTICLPQDSEAEAYDYPENFFERRIHHIERRVPTNGEIKRAAELIAGKKKPMLICGGGVLYSEAGEALRAFAERHGVPFAETQAGKGAILWDHPLNLSGVGVSGSTAGNKIAKEADLVIAVGTRLGDFTTSSRWQFQNPDVDILSINVSGFDAYKMNARQVVADAQLSLYALDNAIGGYKASWGDEVKRLRDEWFVEVDRVLSLETERGIAQTRALGEMWKAMEADDIIISAAGSLPDDVRKFWKTRAYKSYHVEYGFSCMGYEVNAAVGVKLAEPSRGVYAVVGDGTWQMLHSELLTAVQENLKITVVVFDNQGFGCIENLQNSQGIDSFCTRIAARNEKTGRLDGSPLEIDYAKVAEGYGAKGFRASTPQELAEALASAKNEPGVCVIDVKVLPKTMGGRYEGWWRVGTPQVSENPKVLEARKEQDDEIIKAWKY